MIDLASLILILSGGGLYLAAYFGMRELRARPDTPFVRGTSEAYAGLAEYTRLHRLSIVGLSLAGLGVAVGLSAAAHAHKIGRRVNETP